MLNWDDLKYFLVMTEQGSLSAAAKKLGLSQPTLSRHLSTLEEAAGAEIFSRTRSGLQLTALGEKMVQYAQDMRDEVHGLERLITGNDTSMSGTVVVSCIESIGAEWLVQNTRPFHDQNPDITVDFKLTNASTDLLRREADIALRLYRPMQNDLVAKKTVSVNYGLYASKEYIDKYGMPLTARDLKYHKQILPHDDILAMLSKYNRSSVPDRTKATFRSNSFSALSAAVKAGYGIGAQSCLLAAQDPDLVRIFDDKVIYSADLWLVSHPELRRSARIRAMYDYLGDILMTNAKQFAGTA